MLVIETSVLRCCQSAFITEVVKRINSISLLIIARHDAMGERTAFAWELLEQQLAHVLDRVLEAPRVALGLGVKVLHTIL